MTHPRKEETAAAIAKRIYLDFEGYFDALVLEVDKQLIEKDIEEALESYAEQKVKENEEESAKYHDQHLTDATVLIRNEALEEAAKVVAKETPSARSNRYGFVADRFDYISEQIRALKSPERKT